jgi:hypothetical protein
VVAIGLVTPLIGSEQLIRTKVPNKKGDFRMRTMALIVAAAFALSIPTAAVVKAEDTTVIKKDRDFDRDKVIIKKKEPRHLYMYGRDRDDVYVHRHRPAVGVDVNVGR